MAGSLNGHGAASPPPAIAWSAAASLSDGAGPPIFGSDFDQKSIHKRKCFYVTWTEHGRVRFRIPFPLGSLMAGERTPCFVGASGAG